MEMPDKTFLHHNLAKVSLKLANNEQALISYKHALERLLNSIMNSLETEELSFCDEDRQILEDFVSFCDEQSLTQEARYVIDVLETVKNNKKTNSEVKLKVDLFILKFLKISEGEEEVRQGYLKIISRCREEFGVLSQPLQDIFCEFAKTLRQFNMKPDLLDTLYTRLEELTPDYEKPLTGSAGKVESKSFLQKAWRRLRHPKSKINEGASLFNEATSAYNAGDYDEAYARQHMAAKLEYIEAIFALGTYCQLGIGCDINMVEARRFYLRAAKLGHASAQHHYAALLQTGLGGETDLEAAVFWYKNASFQGFSTATMNLAYLYVSTLLGGPYYAAGIAIFLKAYEQGNEAGLDCALQYMSIPVGQFGN